MPVSYTRQNLQFPSRGCSLVEIRYAPLWNLALSAQVIVR